MKTALTILVAMQNNGGVVAAPRDHRSFWSATSQTTGQQEETI